MDTNSTSYGQECAALQTQVDSPEFKGNGTKLSMSICTWLCQRPGPVVFERIKTTTLPPIAGVKFCTAFTPVST